MAISSVKETKSARRIGIGWMIFSLGGAILTALVGVAYFQQQGLTLNDKETVFIVLGQIIFHPFIAGIILAAILAAVMSTISSQLIVTSSALIEDIYKAMFKKDATDAHYVLAGRIAVLAVAILQRLSPGIQKARFSILSALPGQDSVLHLDRLFYYHFTGAS